MATAAAKPPLLLAASAKSQRLASTARKSGPSSALQQIIDALDQNAAILDDTGTIVRVNAAWRAFARHNGCQSPRAGIGSNYLRICDACKDAAEVVGELRAILDGRRVASRVYYELKVAGRSRQYMLTLSVLDMDGLTGVLVLHRDVTSEGVAGEGPVAPEARLRIEFEERRRIARDLHDSTSQHLTAIELLLMSAYRRVSDPQAERLIREAVQSTVTALREMRSFSFLLHPPVLEGGGLAEAMASFVEGYARRIDLPISFAARVESPEALVPFEAALFRVTQEALANIHRHARASCARVELMANANEVMILIEDDGRGMGRDEDAPFDLPGVGIAAMKARVEEFGGTLAIDSPEQGTRLIARIPLTNESERED
ncbi:MAG: histidine kinase [Allosphingosinicella sp.]